MNEVWKTTGKVLFFAFVAMLLAWAANLTIAAVQVALPGDPVAPYLALALFEKGRVDDASKEINEAIRLFPHHDTPHYILAVILCHKGAFEKAVKALEKTLQINPHHRDAMNLLSKIKN